MEELPPLTDPAIAASAAAPPATLVPGETVASLEAEIDLATRRVGAVAKSKGPKEEKMAAIEAVKVLKDRLVELTEAIAAGLVPDAPADAPLAVLAGSDDHCESAPSPQPQQQAGTQKKKKKDKQNKSGGGEGNEKARAGSGRWTARKDSLTLNPLAFTGSVGAAIKLRSSEDPADKLFFDSLETHILEALANKTGERASALAHVVGIAKEAGAGTAADSGGSLRQTAALDGFAVLIDERSHKNRLVATEQHDLRGNLAVFELGILDLIDDLLNASTRDWTESSRLAARRPASGAIQPTAVATAGADTLLYSTTLLALRAVAQGASAQGERRRMHILESRSLAACRSTSAFDSVLFRTVQVLEPDDGFIGHVSRAIHNEDTNVAEAALRVMVNLATTGKNMGGQQ